MKYLIPTFLLFFFLTMTTIGIADNANSVSASTVTAMSHPAARNWKNVRILHIGDSHLENWGLKGTLRRKFQEAGAVYNVSAWKGSSSRSWLRTGKLNKLLQQKSPHVVIVNLGTNVSRAQNPNDYSQFIKKIVRKIAPRECYWVAPPPLIEDNNGFYDMLISATSECHFLDSRKIPFEVPHKKYFHLSKRQSAVWAKYIWDWMNKPSNIPEHPDGI